MGGLGSKPAATYAESHTSTFFQKQKSTLPPRPPPPPSQQQTPTAPPSQHAPPTVTPPHQQFLNECKVVTWLQEEISRVLNLIGTLGDPRPEQAAKLLNQVGRRAHVWKPT